MFWRPSTPPNSPTANSPNGSAGTGGGSGEHPPATSSIATTRMPTARWIIVRVTTPS
jgi:hypothetical protein